MCSWFSFYSTNDPLSYSILKIHPVIQIQLKPPIWINMAVDLRVQSAVIFGCQTVDPLRFRQHRLHHLRVYIGPS